SKIGLVAAALLAAGTIVMYFLRFNVQRHNAELALAHRAEAEKNEIRFRTLTEKSADIIMVTSAEGRITYLSPSVHSILGWHDDAAMGSTLFEHIHQDDTLPTRDALGALVLSAGAATLNFRLGRANGTWPDFECIATNLLHD